ncbi:hypothetical protein M899_0557 [Bacteriovorax sp. BSW11_IV]|uniref:hypothetical protein n=1 Tax=Bacteriovorax sp. BSW11_IV TaxID=1353529 RepID=UPI000389DF72|nr:hypothetical protein [Bacteriovorax sp. BSW11_IV]EQC45049.1 hypothetical protein M899_0557 [Bacteriovorax sp. BSW11_IV]
MAIWQYELNVISKADFESNEEMISSSDDSFLGSVKGWKADVIETGSVDKLLKKKKHWGGPDTLYWGDTEKTDVSLYRQEGLCRYASFRVDIRESNIKDLINMVINFAKDNDGVILNTDCKVVGPSFESVLEDFQKSSCWRFASNPEKYLDNLKDETRPFTAKFERKKFLVHLLIIIFGSSVYFTFFREEDHFRLFFISCFMIMTIAWMNSYLIRTKKMILVRHGFSISSFCLWLLYFLLPQFALWYFFDLLSRDAIFLIALPMAFYSSCIKFKNPIKHQ